MMQQEKIYVEDDIAYSRNNNVLSRRARDAWHCLFDQRFSSGYDSDKITRHDRIEFF